MSYRTYNGVVYGSESIYQNPIACPSRSDRACSRRPRVADLADLAELPDVFVHRKTLIRPSADRQFRASDNLIMFLAVYNVQTVATPERLRLANLAPGRYQAVIETKDMVTRKFTKQEASFEIVP